MKLLSKILTIAALATGLTSCLKDEMIEKQKHGMINLDANKFIELPAPASHSNAFALDFKDVDTVINFVTVRLAATDPAPEDITVQLKMDESEEIIERYNVTNETHLVQFPTSLYSIEGSGLTVTIPKGSKTGTVKLAVNPSTFDPSTTYAIGFHIANVDKPGYTISGNFDSLVVRISAKNKYDGAYTMTTSMTAPDRPTVSATGTEWTWPGEVHLVTTTGNSVNLFDDWGFGDFVHPMQTATGGWSGFGSANARFTFDLSTNKVTAVSNSALNPANGRSFVIDPEGENYFDPGEKILYVSYIMNQPGFAPLKIKSTFKYAGAR